ncbi:MAG TPA: hypothetical protein VIF62_03245 [Labilithrix sp.]|jgi:hypothetical protein
MSRISIAGVLVVLGLASACDKTPKQETTTTSAAQTAATTTSATTTPTAEKNKKLEPLVTFNDDLKTPESVLYDDQADQYLSSNINGKPLDVDNNGYIAKLGPDGKVVDKNFIVGGKKGVTLNAPKGMAFLDDKLFVADIDTVRIFDRKTGAPAGEVKVPGATFLNDVAANADHVFVSDMGAKMGKSGFDPTGTDAVYSIDKTKKLTTIAKSKDLGQPNGLIAQGDKLWVVTMGSGELYSLDMKGKKDGAQKMPKGQNDGLVALPSGDLLVTSWEGKAIYRGKPGGEFKPLVEDVTSPADIGYDTKRSRLLVPSFEKDEIFVFDVR